MYVYVCCSIFLKKHTGEYMYEKDLIENKLKWLQSLLRKKKQ